MNMINTLQGTYIW